MRQILILLSIFVASLSAAAQDKAFFQLPIIPDSLQLLQERTDFMVKHYWDFCDLKKAFSSRDKMSEAFDTYLSFMPYASADVVYASVDNFMKKISKDGKNVLFIGELAEQKLYSDTAIIQSDELFLRFANAVVNNKKVDKTAKLRYQHLVNIVSNSQPGKIAPSFDYTDIYNSTGTFTVDTTKVCTVLFFNDPECSDCNMARIRLNADAITRILIEKGKVDIVSIYASEPNQEWIEQAMDYPKEWLTVASEEVNDLYDMRSTPVFYLLNPNGAIVLRTYSVDDIITIMTRLNQY